MWLDTFAGEQNKTHKMIYIIIAIVFVLGYIFIALEHTFKVDKAAVALLTGISCWVIVMMGKTALFPELTLQDPDFINKEILHHLGEISSILFFLLGAMTIVEAIDSHDGFGAVTSRITTTNKVKLLWIIAITTFFFSAVLDNLTTAIVMVTLLKKIIKEKEDYWFFGGVVIIAANAGGAWSPIGDVTTIMLWIGGQVTAKNIILKVFLPSVVNLLIPLTIASFIGKKTIERPDKVEIDENDDLTITKSERNLIFGIGVAGLLFVPIFKSVTHLPPYMGMLFSLGVVWIVTEMIHRKKPDAHKSRLSISSIITRVDTPSVLFFLGILLAVASLQTAGHLAQLATSLDTAFNQNIYSVNVVIGLLSAIVDNVPLVAGAMGMYPLSVYPVDHVFWEMLAYCAGTGGSVLIIGSAAGVAIMGIAKIDFMWYVKHISWLALVGYFSGALVYYVMNV